MDTLYWNNLDPKIVFDSTVKQFYNRYLWRMVIRAEGGKLLDSKNTNLSEALDNRIQMAKFYNPGSWYHRGQLTPLQVDLELLESVRTIKTNFAGQVKTRVEEPRIQFYASNEHTLKNIAKNLSNRLCIESITGPNSDTVSFLESGAIISRVPITYNYKIIIRDGRYSGEIKQQLLNYLTVLGDDIKLSKTCRDMLNRSYPSIWSVYFYAQDDKVATFISLIDPNLISNIHRMVNVTR